MKMFVFALVLSSNCVLGFNASAARATADEATIADLKRRLALVTTEANLLWKYVASGTENPDIATFNRAVALWDQRRAQRKR